MRTLFIVLASKALDLDARLRHRGERLHVQAFVTQRPIEALGEAVLPGTAWINVERGGLVADESVLNRLRDELRTVVAAQIGGCAMCREEPLKHADHPLSGRRARHLNRQTLACELVHDGQELELGAAETSILHEVVGPDVARTGGLRWRARR